MFARIAGEMRAQRTKLALPSRLSLLPFEVVFALPPEQRQEERRIALSGCNAAASTLTAAPIEDSSSLRFEAPQWCIQKAIPTGQQYKSRRIPKMTDSKPPTVGDKTNRRSSVARHIFAPSVHLLRQSFGRSDWLETRSSTPEWA